MIEDGFECGCDCLCDVSVPSPGDLCDPCLIGACIREAEAEAGGRE